MSIVNKQPVLYILVGLPGSGKDTYLKNKNHNAFELSRDRVRAELGIEGEKPIGTEKQEETVTQIIHARFKKYCDEKVDIIINNTNLKRKYRLPFIEDARKYGYAISIVFFNTPLDICILRRKNQISEEIIRKMWMEFEFPRKDEWDAIIIVDQYPLSVKKRNATSTFDNSDFPNKFVLPNPGRTKLSLELERFLVPKDYREITQMELKTKPIVPKTKKRLYSIIDKLLKLFK